jgi:hypothetical protein
VKTILVILEGLLVVNNGVLLLLYHLHTTFLVLGHYAAKNTATFFCFFYEKTHSSLWGIPSGGLKTKTNLRLKALDFEYLRNKSCSS